MFSKTIDSKLTYVNDEGVEMVDLGESIFGKNIGMSQICSICKLRPEYRMRPDLVSKTLYGSTDYTEMILKYSLISNPFSLDADDNVFSVSLPYIYNPVIDIAQDKKQTSNFIKNYHKYIDKNKVPSAAGSEKLDKEVTTTDTEANISKTGTTGIVVKNGKVYFGAIDEDIADTTIVDCAENGVSLGEFLNATLVNSK